MGIEQFAGQHFGFFECEAKVDVSIHDRFFALERVFGVFGDLTVGFDDLFESITWCAATHLHPPVRYFFGTADLAVVQLRDQSFAVFANRVKHLRDVHVPVADLDALDIFTDQRIEGAHVLNHIGDRQHFGFVQMADVFQQ